VAVSILLSHIRKFQAPAALPPGKTGGIPRILGWMGSSCIGSFEKDKSVLPVVGNRTLNHTGSSLVSIPTTVAQSQVVK